MSPSESGVKMVVWGDRDAKIFAVVVGGPNRLWHGLQRSSTNRHSTSRLQNCPNASLRRKNSNKSCVCQPSFRSPPNRSPTLQVLTNPSSHAVYNKRSALPPATTGAPPPPAAVIGSVPTPLAPTPPLRPSEPSVLIPPPPPPPPSKEPSLLLMAVKPGLFGCRAATPKMNAPEDASQKCSSPDAVPEHSASWLVQGARAEQRWWERSIGLLSQYSDHTLQVYTPF